MGNIVYQKQSSEMFGSIPISFFVSWKKKYLFPNCDVRIVKHRSLALFKYNSTTVFFTWLSLMLFSNNEWHSNCLQSPHGEQGNKNTRGATEHLRFLKETMSKWNLKAEINWLAKWSGVVCQILNLAQRSLRKIAVRCFFVVF